MKRDTARPGQRVWHPNRGRVGYGTIHRVYHDWQGTETAIIDYDDGKREAAQTVRLIGEEEKRSA